MKTNENEILKNNQIGFCKGFRTADQLLAINTLINKYLSENKNLKLYFCFVDFRNRYYCIWCQALIKKFHVRELVFPCFLIYEKTKLSVHLPRGTIEFSPSDVGLER